MMYSKRTFHFAVFSMLLVLLFVALSFMERSPSWNLDDIIGYFIILLIVCAIMGVLTGLMALREIPNTRKWVGLVINSAILIGIVLFLTQNLNK